MMLGRLALLESGVVGLNGFGRPPAISWFVVAVYVDAVECVFRWPLSHVIQEVLKRIEPSITYLNAASAVVAKLRGRRGVAAALHGRPRDKRWSERVAPRMSVRSGRFPRRFRLEATATLRVAAVQVLASDDSGIAAIAPAGPMESCLVPLPCSMRQLDSYKSPESLARDVFGRESHTSIIAGNANENA